MATREIEISFKETSIEVAREYAIVFDNGVVELRRNVRQKQTARESANPNLTPNVADNPKSRLTVEQIKELAKQLV